MASTETAVKAAHDKVDELAEHNVDTTESDIRYLAYGARLRTALRASGRYIAYVSATFLLRLLTLIFWRNYRRVTLERHFAQ